MPSRKRKCIRRRVTSQAKKKEHRTNPKKGSIFPPKKAKSHMVFSHAHCTRRTRHLFPLPYAFRPIYFRNALGGQKCVSDPLEITESWEVGRFSIFAFFEKYIMSRIVWRARRRPKRRAACQIHCHPGQFGAKKKKTFFEKKTCFFTFVEEGKFPGPKSGWRKRHAKHRYFIGFCVFLTCRALQKSRE